MEVKASLKNYRVSAQKARLLADQIRGKGVEDALTMLTLSKKRFAKPLAKLVRSAVANAEYTNEQQDTGIRSEALAVIVRGSEAADAAADDDQVVRLIEVGRRRGEAGPLAGGGLVPIASGQGHDAAISIRQRDAVLWGGRLTPGERTVVPEAPFGHLFVAKGSVELEDHGVLATGDAARLTRDDGPSLVAGPDGAEVLIWATGAM